VFDFTLAVSEATDLGIFLFCVNQWDFGHLHPSGFDPALIRRIVDEIDTVVAVKNEIGGPGVGGLAQVFHDLGDEVVVTDPFEQNAPAWVWAAGMQFMGTSNYEYLGAAPVEMFEHLRAGRMDEAMAIYWKVHPARQANAQIAATYMPGGGLVHRQLWKYQAWLNGFNGGPLRQPHLRLGGAQRRQLRDAHTRSGLDTTSDDDSAFYVGRNPME
jgi:dihydrodipicolinate synthase/N-acetylneuraminate lyase